MSFERGFLNSGVEVLMEPAPNLRSVAIGFWIRVGSRNEPREAMGISHLIEHLIFKGTKKRGAKEISDIFEGLGAEVNAFTSKEHTCYYARVIDENLGEVVNLLSEMLSAPAFRESDLSSEKEVVLEEIHHYEDTPDELIHDLFAETLWDNHPLGQSIIGCNHTVSGFKAEDISNFFSRHYTFEKTLVTVSGSFDKDNLFGLLEGGLKMSEFKSSPHPEVAVKVERRNRVMKKDTEQAHMCFGYEGLGGGDGDRFAVNILDGILAGGMSSRLFQKIREEKGLAYSVFSYHSFYRDTGSLAVYVGTRPKNIDEVISLIEKEVDSLLTKGVNEAELNRVKNQTKGCLVLSMESTSSRMSRLGRSYLLHSEVLSLDEIIERVDSVTANDIARVCERVFKPGKRALSVIGPFDKDRFDT
ncbi:MAG: pitrilysin family protein [Actinomycetota bacterium]|nr:pitrilysin family protein [Actinomycetota bacterium]